MPADQEDGSDYKIKITCNADTNIYDLSDENFSITASQPTTQVNLQVNPAVLSLPTGGTQVLAATVDPADASIGYTSSNPAVATVDQSGLVTAMAPGTAGITVTASKTGYLDATPVVAQVTVSGTAATILSAPTVAGTPGAGVTIPVTLKSNGNVSSIQFDLNFDSSLLGYTSATKGSLVTTDHVLTANIVEAGKVRVVLFSLNSATLPAGEGELAVLSFNVAAGAQPGDSCPLSLTSTALSGVNAGSVPAEVLDGLFLVPERQKGDINGDGVINVQDVVLTVNIILGKTTPTGEMEHAADANGDGMINVQDVVKIVNVILGKV